MEEPLRKRTEQECRLSFEKWKKTNNLEGIDFKFRFNSFTYSVDLFCQGPYCDYSFSMMNIKTCDKTEDFHAYMARLIPGLCPHYYYQETFASKCPDSPFMEEFSQEVLSICRPELFKKKESDLYGQTYITGFY